MGYEQLTTLGHFYMEPDVREVRKPPARWREPANYRTREPVSHRAREPVIHRTPEPAVPPKPKPIPILLVRLEELESGLKEVVVMLGEAPMTHRFKQLNQLYNTLEELSINKNRKTGPYRIEELESGLVDAVVFLKKSKQTWRYKQLRQVHDDFVELLENRREEGTME